QGLHAGLQGVHRAAAPSAGGLRHAAVAARPYWLETVGRRVRRPEPRSLRREAGGRRQARSRRTARARGRPAGHRGLLRRATQSRDNSHLLESITDVFWRRRRPCSLPDLGSSLVISPVVTTIRTSRSCPSSIVREAWPTRDW